MLTSQENQLVFKEYKLSEFFKDFLTSFLSVKLLVLQKQNLLI